MVKPQKPIRLKPLPKLAVKNSFAKQGQSECMVLLSSMLTCWASYGQGNKVCSTFETQLKQCADTKVEKKPSRTAINYHLARIYPRISGKPHD